MNHSPRTCGKPGAAGECGGSRLNFLIVVLVIAAVAYVGYQVVPVVFNASTYKVYMQDTVDKAVALGQGAEWARSQLRAGGADYGVPSNAVIETSNTEGRLIVRVQWTRPIPLPGYTYNYNFDHTVKSGKFLSQ